MIRLAQFEVSRGLSSPFARIAARVVFGVACALAMIAARGVIDPWSPGAGPFALIYPVVLLATLYGRWEAGVVTYAISFFWAWTRIMPLRPIDLTTVPGYLNGVVINGISLLVVIAFAETFRAAVESGRKQRDAEIERRAVLLAELEHRTKNNFALVASLLELQKRREDSIQVREAFDDAIGRVRTFAEAYTHLVGEPGEGVVVAMRPYLERLVDRVSRAILPPHVTVSGAFAEVSLPRESAVAIALFANEALTNCAKYAFPDGKPGKVDLILAADGEDWTLTVRDDGVGQAAAPSPPGGGIGTQLLEAFAQQAKGRHETSYACGGCEVSLIYVSAEA